MKRMTWLSWVHAAACSIFGTAKATTRTQDFRIIATKAIRSKERPIQDAEGANVTSQEILFNREECKIFPAIL